VQKKDGKISTTCANMSFLIQWNWIWQCQRTQDSHQDVILESTLNLITLSSKPTMAISVQDKQLQLPISNSMVHNQQRCNEWWDNAKFTHAIGKWYGNGFCRGYSPNGYSKTKQEKKINFHEIKDVPVPSTKYWISWCDIEWYAKWWCITNTCLDKKSFYNLFYERECNTFLGPSTAVTITKPKPMTKTRMQIQRLIHWCVFWGTFYFTILLATNTGHMQNDTIVMHANHDILHSELVPLQPYLQVIYE